MAHHLERNFKLTLEYDGTNYHGWQKQKGLLSIQEVVESRLAIMLNREVHIRAAGRTDAGVHALGQVINFYARTRLNPEDFKRGLNSLLPEDIVVKEAEEVDHSFHATYSAKGKVYCYKVLNRKTPSALYRRYAWHVPYELNFEEMGRALKYLEGEHDFTSFRASRSSVKSSVRILYRAEFVPIGDGMLLFTFVGNGFLRHMVRIIVGTVIEVGTGKRKSEDMPRIIEAKDRNVAGITAPAHGLYLVKVIYNEEELEGEKRGHGTISESFKYKFFCHPYY